MTSVLISGASVAGPSVAFWLNRLGYRTTVVERAPTRRGGGNAVEVRGRIHLGVLDRMGILPAVRAATTDLASLSYVDNNGRVVAPLPAEVFAGDVEILRGDLGRILYEATISDTEYLFGDTVTSLAEDDGGVDVTFQHGRPLRFDLVVGADGVRSAVRRLAFGDEARDRRDLG